MEALSLNRTFPSDSGSFGLLLRRWWLLLLAALAGGAIALATGALLPSWYEVTTELALLSVDDPTTPALTSSVEHANAELPLLAAILHSHELADRVIEELGLTRAYRISSLEAARRELSHHTRISIDRKANLVTLSAEDRDPIRAFQLARRLGELASQRSADLWSARSREHRRRLEIELAAARTSLTTSEQALAQFREQHQIIDLAEQLRATVAEASSLGRLLIEKRLVIDFNRGFAAEGSPEIVRAKREASGAARALSLLRRQGSGGSGSLLPIDPLPEIEREHERLRRLVDLDASHLETLSKQVDQLRAVETRPIGRAEVVSAPSLPERPIRPARALLTTFGTLLGTGLAAIALLLLELSKRRRADSLSII